MSSESPTSPHVSEDESAIEEAAREKLGLRWWDRPTLFRETADAATDTDLPFWAVLLLSGAIATLGLALDATAVVIGAMLVAPLLGPLLGLSLALAVGDGRLALQTALTILLGAVGVIALAALLTVLLPFQDVTSEISARTRPTTLDLAIAVFSGLAGAVVTVSRGHRLSASIPGVAIAVALIPPLGVAGFAIGTGRWAMVEGPLLLFGANLGGIVLSGMGAFLLVGMHRDDVVETARTWHNTADLPGLAGRISRSPLLRQVRVLTSPIARVALVLAFVAAVAFPLTSSLQQVLRETRASRAAMVAEAALQSDGTASVLSRDVTMGDKRVQIRLRTATTEWIGDERRAQIEKRATEIAGEPVALTLEQLIASDGDLDAFAAMLPESPSPPTSTSLPEQPQATLQRLRGEVTDALDALALPDSVHVLGTDVRLASGPSLLVTYAAPRRLSPDAESILTRQLASSLQLDPAAVSLVALSTRPRALPRDSTSTVELATLLQRHPRLRATLRADSASATATHRRLVSAGAPDRQVTFRIDTSERVTFSVLQQPE
ncbi:MAG: hypothetical protein Rubg2KO_07370 [Rubricoccaceae bacterium]